MEKSNVPVRREKKKIKRYCRITYSATVQLEEISRRIQVQRNRIFLPTIKRQRDMIFLPTIRRPACTEALKLMVDDNCSCRMCTGSARRCPGGHLPFPPPPGQLTVADTKVCMMRGNPPPTISSKAQRTFRYTDCYHTSPVYNTI